MIGGVTFVTEPAMAAVVGSIIFVVVVVGGMGSLAGAFIASLLIGLLQTLPLTVDSSLADLIKIFGGQHYEQTRFDRAAAQFRQLRMKEQIAAALNVPIVQMFAAVAVGLVIRQVTLDVQADRTTVGSFVSFIAAMLLILAPLKRLTSVSEHMQRGLSAAESVFGLLDEPPEDDRGTMQLGRSRGDVRFEGMRSSCKVN